MHSSIDRRARPKTPIQETPKITKKQRLLEHPKRHLGAEVDMIRHAAAAKKTSLPSDVNTTKKTNQTSTTKAQVRGSDG